MKHFLIIILGILFLAPFNYSFSNEELPQHFSIDNGKVKFVDENKTFEGTLNKETGDITGTLTDNSTGEKTPYILNVKTKTIRDATTGEITDFPKH